MLNTGFVLLKKSASLKK